MKENENLANQPPEAIRLAVMPAAKQPARQLALLLRL
jgi:hypothetical protein